MAAISDYLEQAILNHWLRNTAMAAPPANVYIALFTAAPSDAVGGTEVTGGNYARAAVSTSGAGAFSAPGTAGVSSNPAAIVFGTPTANWGTITHIGIFDALTAGNLLFHGALTTARVVNNGDAAPQFAANALSVTVA